MVGYVSPYGPKLRPTVNVRGFPLKSLTGLGISAGAFGAVALGTVVYFGEGIPRIQQDVLSKLPIIGSYWTGREIPPSDNPF